MTTRLKKIRFREVSFCGRGANQHAHVLIAKAMADHDYEGDGATCTKCGDPKADHIAKEAGGLSTGRTPTVRFDSTLGDPEGTMPETIDKSKLDPEVAKYIGELEAKVAKAEPAEPTVEDLLKDANPALVELVKSAQKAADDALVLAKANAERADAEILKAEIASETEILKGLDNLGIEIAKVAPALQALRKSSPDAAAAMVTALTAANAQAETGVLFEELGKGATDDDGSTAWSRIQAVGKRLLEEGKAATLEQGIAKALDERPDLARAYAAQNYTDPNAG